MNTSPEPVLQPNPDWHTYRAGEADRAGRRIAKVHALDAHYIIYFIDGEVFYEATPDLEEKLGNANVALSRINRLLPSGDLDRATFLRKFSTLELAADAYEMIFCGHVVEGLTILNDIRDKLQTTAEGKRRLFYQLGSILVTVVVWAVYLALISTELMPEGWQPWMMAAALALAGGVFSVCLNLASLQVSINQPGLFLWSAGATRSVVALLAGVGLLLAMRSKMVAALVYSNDTTIAASAPLLMAEMFFCFLAGFSETFVPNILRDSEKNPSGARTGTMEQARMVEQALAAEQAKAAEQAQAAGQVKAANTTGKAVVARAEDACDDAEIDGCDVAITDLTADEDLPASTGGVA